MKELENKKLNVYLKGMMNEAKEL